MTKDLNELTIDELGKLFPVIIVDHNSEWRNLYLHEEQLICETVGNNIHNIEHIGSTAVPGLAAKPTIDILIEILKESSKDSLINDMKKIGYHHIPKPENPPPHIMFAKGYTREGVTEQTFHVHIRYPGDWDEPLFRNYLINHPEKAIEYGKLKLELADKYRNDREKYTDSKTSFIRDIMNEVRSMKTAVVFGSTGLVGRELIYELLEKNDYIKIIAVIRKELPVSDPRIESILLDDFSHLTEFKDRLKATTYFCCIGTTIKIAGTKERFRQVDLDIPKMIAQVAELLSIPNMVVISSIGASDRSSNFYLRTKGEMEKAVRDIYSGNLKIVRPSLLIGHRDDPRFGERTAAIFMTMFGWLFAGPLKKYKGIRARDVARAMIIISSFPADRVVIESGELHELIAY
jgi:GrpB-like predicted nucleotidyltransferase (UPF0157 family)/uncharacterized protein YbjT (DUF2867 family)